MNIHPISIPDFIGEEIVNYFQQNYMGTPVEAEFLGNAGFRQHNYRITFDDGSVADFKITFESDTGTRFVIESAEQYNQVI